MGVLSDDEIEFEEGYPEVETPPGSPTLAASHAQAITESFTATFSELNSHVARNYASVCCEEFGLTDMDKDDVMRTSQMHTHLIAIRQYSRVVTLTRSIQKLIVESFLNSTEFKDHITRRIQATFLDADLPTYVRGSTSRLIRHMQMNPASWRIPVAVHANFLNSKAFTKAVGAIASNFRGELRRKIKKSASDKLDIGALANKLCVKGYQPTQDHLRRYALLRVYMIDWEKVPITRGKGRPISFWAFIDSKLDKLKDVCARPTEAETKKAIKDVLKANMKIDEGKFPGPASGKTKLSSRVQLPEWQMDHAKAVKDMSAYIVDASPDDEVEDDDAPNISNVAAQGAPMEEDHGDDGDDEHDTGLEMSHTNPTVPTPGPNVTEQGTRAAPTGRILVPETQESPPRTQETSLRTQSGSNTSPGSESFVPETPRPADQQTREAESHRSRSPESAPGQTTQTGWAGGSLVDRRTRAACQSASPTARANPPTMSRQRRSRVLQSHPVSESSNTGA